ncbi:hypothetical protein BJX68DRAFT_258457 [Aspergillus pseudodeflectus]|uniref:FAD/NAD(P)-binding domain-containing protein n=1 Tax=Aspergillus pseudodeflectus TaxID=176178 RepID=A0ABR4JKV7_9EURO
MYDALIVGSGPGGLSVALGLSRTNRRATIFTQLGGAGFRNEGAHEMRNFNSRDGIAPEEFRQIGTGTVHFIEAEIVAMKRQKPGLRPLQGIPTFPSPMYTHMAQIMNLITTPTSGPPSVFTDGPLPEIEAMQRALTQTKAFECSIETGEFVKLVPAQTPDVGVTVALEGGNECKMGYLGHEPSTVLAGADMAAKLGVEIEDNPMLGRNIKVVDPTFSTLVHGVFVAGDAATP